MDIKGSVMNQGRLRVLAHDAEGTTCIWIRRKRHMTKHWYVMTCNENELCIKLIKSLKSQ